MALEEGIASSLLRQHLLRLAERGERKDNRAFDELRPISIREGVFTKGEGEAWVSLGKTQVLVALKANVGEPFSDTPDRGVLITNAELLPLASPSFEPGPPREKAIEIARVVDRAFRGSGAIDLSNMVLEEGKLVWILFLDMYALDFDGNLFDAMTLASLLALIRARLPLVEVGSEGRPITVEGQKVAAPLTNYPLNFSFAKIGKHLMLDPDLEEEAGSDGLLTLGLDKDLNICSIQKRKGTFMVEEIHKVAEIARSKYPELASQFIEREIERD